MKEIADHMTGRVAARSAVSMSSFNEMATYFPEMQVDLKSTYPISEQRDRIIASNGGDVSQTDAEFRVFTSADASSSVVFQSVERGRYVAGMDGIAGVAIRIPERPTGNQVVEWGYTDFTNGFVCGEDVDGVYFGIYRDGTLIQKVYRENWLYDVPGYDPANLTIYRWPFRFYGMGPIRLTIAGVSDGRGTVFDAHYLTQTDELPVITNPEQPLAVRIQNNGTADNLEAFVAGRQFEVCGVYDPLFRVTSARRLSQSVGTTFIPLVSYRQKTGAYESINTRFSGVSILADDDLIIQLRVLSTLTGASWQNPPNTNNGVETAMEYDASATAVSGGLQVYESLFAGGQGGQTSALSTEIPRLDLPGQNQVVGLVARSISGTATVSSVVRVREAW